MVNPIYIFAIALGVAFLLSLFDKVSRYLSVLIFYTALGSFLVFSGIWFVDFVNGAAVKQIFTAGFNPPYSINLQLGLHESFFILMINAVGFLGGIYLFDRFTKDSINSMILFLMAIMGFNGIVLTQDLFNLFVFIEVSSIAIYSLIAFDKNLKSLSAGFKYIIAGSIASAFFLIGIIFIYRYSGTLNISDIGSALTVGKIGIVAVYLLFISLIIELKPFPVNGWALDVYESVNPGIAAIISGAAVAASFFALSKVLPMLGETWYTITAWVGVITFLGSNLFGLNQKSAKRLLGYSSIALVGLLLTILGLGKTFGADTEYLIFGILISHFFAKIGLFWISGMVKGDKLSDWAVLNKSPWMLFLMSTFILALTALPPFPSFFAKWSIFLKLSSAGLYGWMVLILVGSFLEALYLFRWFGYVIKMKTNEKDDSALELPLTKFVPVILVAAGLYATSWAVEGFYNSGYFINYIPFLFVAALFLLDFLPNRVKAVLVISGMSYYAYTVIPGQHGYALIFNSIFLLGGVVTLISSFAVGGQRKGFFPFVLIMFIGLSGLTEANNMLSFFVSWEFMTIGSYFLIIRGKNSMPHALSYILFSLGGAFLILMGFSLAAGLNMNGGIISQDVLSLATLGKSGIYAPVIWGLLALGFLTKAAAFGLHIWLPGAHSEAESDVSPLVSAILLKAGIFGLIILMINMGSGEILTIFGKIKLSYILGWLGAITAIAGTMGAIFQEDAKRLLAYSSIGQLGYIIFALSFMTKLGWTMAILYSVIHFLYKSALFLGIGGVYMRTKTKNMYEMGGLIKKMPFTWISILISIIALSGVPPLIGFGGKWFTYNAVLESGWYLQGTMVLFAGFAAFLYCYRILFAPFLGQPKDNFRNIKEAPVFMLIPQYIFLAGLMFLSVKPGALLKYVGELVGKTAALTGSNIIWEGEKAISKYGSWDPVLIMIVVGVVFTVILLWLFYNVRSPHKVKQFNIVYSGESPERPETTHFAWNFHAGYQKGIGFLHTMVVEKFWDWISEAIHAVSDQFRRIYTGNGQTYALQIVIYTVVIYFIISGGF